VNEFRYIDSDFLASIATDSDRIPTLYYSKHLAVRVFFWMRLRFLFRLMKRHSKHEERCLDFGGGSGVFLPSLAAFFKQVVCIDLENEEALKIIAHCSIDNVELVKSDISTAQLKPASFQAIVAADVLEHFKDISIAVDAISKWLARDGFLYTSLPTENWLYLILRKTFKVQKPWDHYHTAAEVESFLEESGFEKVQGIYVPLFYSIFPLFRISVWRLS